MNHSIITHETLGDVKHLEGRDVYWLQLPLYTGAKYSSACCVIYQPGDRSKPAHSHAFGEETVYVVTGTGKVKIASEIYDIRAGSLFLVSQNTPHMVWNNGAEPLKLICFYAPCSSAVEYTFHQDFDFPEFESEQ